jgi:hypothetical protein
VPLARGSQRPLTVVVPKIVDYPQSTDEAADAAAAAVEDYKEFIDELDGNGSVRLCLCRSVDDLIERMTAPNMTIVVGGPSGRWRMSPEERFANRLSRRGRRVVFASTGPSTTSRRMACDPIPV